MVLDIVQTGDPVLRHRARELEPSEIKTPFVQELIAAMLHTLREVPGVGLAAPQVGESLRIVVIADRSDFVESMSDARLEQLERRELPEQVLINPEITVGTGTAEFFEGCLSVVGLSAIVSRATEVQLRALSEQGDPIETSYSGWPARILQHEVDHLDGALYVDRMDPRTLTTQANLGRWWKARPADEVRAALSPTRQHA